jgi:hypothetical protein
MTWQLEYASRARFEVSVCFDYIMRIKIFKMVLELDAQVAADVRSRPLAVHD